MSRDIPVKITYDFGKQPRSMHEVIVEAVILEAALTEMFELNRLDMAQTNALIGLRAMILKYKEHLCPKKN